MTPAGWLRLMLPQRDLVQKGGRGDHVASVTDTGRLAGREEGPNPSQDVLSHGPSGLHVHPEGEAVLGGNSGKPARTVRAEAEGNKVHKARELLL